MISRRGWGYKKTIAGHLFDLEKKEWSGSRKKSSELRLKGPGHILGSQLISLTSLVWTSLIPRKAYGELKPVDYRL